MEYQAGYRVDKTGGGSLTCGNESGKSLTVKVTSATQSVTVTAVPEDGYVFVKWSDGVTKRTRTDTNFDQNVDVTAVFAAASIRSSSSRQGYAGGLLHLQSCPQGQVSGCFQHPLVCQWHRGDTGCRQDFRKG